jgi:HK97 family phage major capsid protein
MKSSKMIISMLFFSLLGIILGSTLGFGHEFAIGGATVGGAVGLGVSQIVIPVGYMGLNLPGMEEKTLIEKRGTFIKEMKSLRDKAVEEARALGSDELEQFNKLKGDVAAIDVEMEQRNYLKNLDEKFAQEKGEKRQQSKEERKFVKDFSYLKFIREANPANKAGLTGLELEAHQEAEKEARENGKALSGVGIPGFVLLGEQRDITAEGTTSVTGDQGGKTIQTTKTGFIDLLRAKLVMKQMGAQMLTGLQGDISIPRLKTGATAVWAAENADATESSQLFDDVTLSPERLATFTEISKQLLVQSSIDVEKLVLNDLVMAVQTALDSAAINGSGSSNQPTGILNTIGIGSVVGGADGANPDWADIIDLEKEVAVDNADLGALRYLTNPKVRGYLKKTKLDTGSGKFIWPQDAKEINGYPVDVTTQVPSNLTKGESGAVCSAILFGNFNDLLIGQWGGLDIVIDPYTGAKANKLIITINTLWDIAVRHPESFAAMKDALTS